MHAGRACVRPSPDWPVGRRQADVPTTRGCPSRAGRDRLGGATRPLTGEISAVNDQHAFLRLDPATPLRVGEVVRLGLSTRAPRSTMAVDPVLANAPGDGVEDDPVVTDLVRTFF